MKKKISKEAKAIADAHIQARVNNTFDNPTFSSAAELIALLRQGKTMSKVLDEIEYRYCSITTLLLSSHFDHRSASYKSNVYKGFKSLLDN